MKECKLINSPIVYHVAENGHDQWILFLHAAFVDHHMFDAQVEFFRKDYNVMTIDIIGHGGSTCARKGDTIQKMSLWINEILAERSISKIHVVGVSIGAVLAQDFANQYPQRVASLACFGGYDINDFDPKVQKENDAGHALMMLKAIFSVKWFAEDNKKISAYTTPAQEAFYNMNLRFPKKSFMYLGGLNRMVNVHKPSPRPYPLLIGCGEHDIPAELTLVDLWKKKEPTVSVMVFEGAGHCVNMDVPDAFNHTLHRFLQDGTL